MKIPRELTGWAQIAGALRDPAVPVQRVPQNERGDRLLARIGDGPRHLLLLGHMESLYPRGTVATHPLRLEGEKTFGPGAEDMRGGHRPRLHAQGPRSMPGECFRRLAQPS